MGIRYKTYKSNFTDKEGNDVNYILAKNIETLSIDEMNYLITDACSVNNSDIAAVLEAFKLIISMYLGRGRNVPLYDLGVLKPKITAKFDGNGRVINGSEAIKTIQFIPSAKFLRLIRDKSKFEHTNKMPKESENFEIRSTKFLNSIEQKTLFTRKEYAYFIKRDYKVAVLDIEKLLKENKVEIKRFGRDLFYYKL